MSQLYSPDPASIGRFSGAQKQWRDPRSFLEAPHDAIECASSRAPLLSLIRQLAWLQGHSQNLPRWLAWEPIGSALPCLAAAVIHCRPLQAGARWLELLLLLLLLLLLILQLLLLLLLLVLLQRPNEFYTESDRTIWCTGTPNNRLLYIDWDSIQQLWYCSKDDVFPL